MDKKEAVILEGIDAAMDSQASQDAGADQYVDDITSALKANPGLRRDPNLRSALARLAAVLADTGYEDITEQVAMERQIQDAAAAQRAQVVWWTPPESGAVNINGVDWRWTKDVPVQVPPGVIENYKDNLKRAAEADRLREQMKGTLIGEELTPLLLGYGGKGVILPR